MPPEVVAAIAPRGHRDVGEYLRGWFDSWHMYQPEPEDFVAAGDQVVALVHLRARGKGSRFEIEEDDRRRVRVRRRQDLQAAPLRAQGHGARTVARQLNARG